MAAPVRLPDLLDRLKTIYGPQEPQHPTDAVGLLLWENVAYLVDDDRRSAAFSSLAATVGLDPGAIGTASDADLLAVVVGMRPTERVARLRNVAALAQRHLLPDPDTVLRQPLKVAVRELRRFPGVGDPSAERILLFSGHHRVLPLDSNALRVLTRLGFGEASENYQTSYRSAQMAAQAQLPPDTDALIRASLLLRRHGKEICRRTTPACPACPLQSDCQFGQAAAKLPPPGVAAREHREPG